MCLTKQSHLAVVFKCLFHSLQLPSVPKSSDGLLLVLLFSPGVWGPMICSHFLRGSYRGPEDI